VTEPAVRPEVRVGSSTNGLAPISVAERSVNAGPYEWLALGAIAAAAVVADQVTKRIVATTLPTPAITKGDSNLEEQWIAGDKQAHSRA